MYSYQSMCMHDKFSSLCFCKISQNAIASVLTDLALLRNQQKWLISSVPVTHDFLWSSPACLYIAKCYQNGSALKIVLTKFGYLNSMNLLHH